VRRIAGPRRSKNGLLRTRPAQPVEPERHDQSTRGVRGQDGLGTGRLVADHCHRAVEFDVVSREVRSEMRGLAGSPGPPTFAEVDGVEREAQTREVIGELGVEEIVGIAVDVEDRVCGGRVALRRALSDEGGDDLALAVRVQAQGQRSLKVAGQNVWLPGVARLMRAVHRFWRHATYLNETAEKHAGITLASSGGIRCRYRRVLTNGCQTHQPPPPMRCSLAPAS
jgi:hypothetical protein